MRLAALHCDHGRIAEAVSPLERALELEPSHREALVRLGAVLQHLGQLARSESVLMDAVAAHPRHAPAWTNLGIVRLRQAGNGNPARLESARQALAQALTLDPDRPLALRALGQVLHRQDDLTGCLHTLQRLMRLEPQRWPELLDLGNALATRDRHTDAETAYRSALAAASLSAEPPTSPDGPPPLALLHANLGATLLNLEQPEPAHLNLLEALRLWPALPDAEVNLGLALRLLDQPEAALAACDRALALEPSLPAALSLRGVLQRALGHLEAAETTLRQALAQAPQDAGILSHLMGVLHDQGRQAEAITLANGRLCRFPDHQAVRLQRGVCRLSGSGLRQGWEDYEARLALRDRRPLLPRETPPWTASQPQDGPMLLIGEQGIGDMLQFARFAPAVKRRFGSVVLCVYPELVELLSLAGLADAVQGPQDCSSHAGPWLPMMSVCHALAGTPRELSPAAPYLKLPAERAAHWRSRLRRGGERLIGLHWQGNPVSERGENWGRSFPLALFEPLSRLSGVRFVSLQKGPGMEQLQSCGFRSRFIDDQDAVDQAWGFVDSAAIASCCDLVISSDSGLVHLAGGLGLPVWVLLKHVPEWRWGLEGECSPWYPSARLFRQPWRGDWPGVIERVLQALPEALARVPAPARP